MKKKTRCYIYTRVSTAIQVDGYSLDAQKDKLRKYAEFQDMARKWLGLMVFLWIMSSLMNTLFPWESYQHLRRLFC